MMLMKMATRKEKISDAALAITEYHFGCSARDLSSASFDITTTANTFDYLLDSGFSAIEVIKEANRHKGKAITYDDLSESLWEGSLIKKGAFYLHRELRLESPRPVFDIKAEEVIQYPFYVEMKIRYTEDDVLDYFLKKMKPTLRASNDPCWDRRVLREYLKRFSKLDFAEALDVILCSIDRYMKENPDCYNLRDISVASGEVIEELSADLQELQMADRRKMVHRRKCLT